MGVELASRASIQKGKDYEFVDLDKDGRVFEAGTNADDIAQCREFWPAAGQWLKPSQADPWVMSTSPGLGLYGLYLSAVSGLQAA
jgi:hypothetical protein